MTEPQQRRTPSDAQSRPGFVDGLRRGALIGALLGAVLLALVVMSGIHLHMPGAGHSPGMSQAGVATPPRAPARTAVRLADFKNEQPTPEAREMADWVLTSGDAHGKSFVIVDKKDARVYVFDTLGRLKESAPALLGAAVGDDSAPGIGDKPLADVLPSEKTTPAGRFVADVGMSTRGEDVVWVDYGAAVSMHRVLNVPERLASLASATTADNRMSFGCINLPPKFYEKVLRPTVDATGAVIYILPETRSLSATFASFYDVDSGRQMAQH